MADAARILFLSIDEQTNRLLREVLIVEWGFAVSFVPGIKEAIEALKESSVDIVIIKIPLGDSDMRQTPRDLKKIDPEAIIIGLLDNPDDETQNSLLRSGFYEVLTKPFNKEKLLFLIKKGAELHAFLSANFKLTQGLKEHNSSLEKQNILLAKRIEESAKNLARLYEDLRSTYMRTIKVLAHAIDARDHYTHSHSENVAKYAQVIANEMGLTAKEIETLREACELHDLGKIGIEDNILSKPSKLNEQEWDQVKRHPTMGANILEPLTFLSDVIELVRQHHDHYDGSGYHEGR